VAQGVPGSLRPQIFLTFRHYTGGRLSAKRTSHLYPRKNPWYSLSEAESTSGHMVLSEEPWKKSPVTPLGIDPGTVRLVAQHLNHYATPVPPIMIMYLLENKMIIFFPTSTPEYREMSYNHAQTSTRTAQVCSGNGRLYGGCRHMQGNYIFR